MFFKLSKHLKKFLLVYSILAIGIGWILGLQFQNFAKINKIFFRQIITVIVFFMIYPMMINLNLGKILKVFKKPKPMALSLIYNFVITPILSFVLIALFIHNKLLALGFLLVMIIPGSSMSIGYAGLAGGDIEIATMSLGINFILIPIMLPLWLKILGSTYNVPIPLWLLLKTILIVLIIPMFLGDITRRGILKKYGTEKFLDLKPLFSSITMIMMFLIVMVIFFLKAPILLKKWQVMINLAIVNTIFLIIMLAVITIINKIFKLSYEEHMGITFLSTGKNNGTAIAIATVGFAPMVAIPAAVLPIFQIILLIFYLKMENIIRNFFYKKGGEI